MIIGNPFTLQKYTKIRKGDAQHWRALDFDINHPATLYTSLHLSLSCP
jgi:hypothetical protein